jgi:hypothetical protein
MLLRGRKCFVDIIPHFFPNIPPEFIYGLFSGHSSSLNIVTVLINHHSFGSMTQSSILHENAIVFWKIFFHSWKKKAGVQNVYFYSFYINPFTAYHASVPFPTIILQTMILPGYLMLCFTQSASGSLTRYAPYKSMSLFHYLHCYIREAHL